MSAEKINSVELRHYLAGCGPDTSIYLGVDSRRYREKGIWFANFTCVVVVHVDSCHGAKIFGQTEKIRLYDNAPQKPSERLMIEVQKVIELHELLKDCFEGFRVEIHLDLNPDKRYKSSAVTQQAIGYIRGCLMIEPKLKPSAWAASFAADRFESLKSAA